MKRKEGWYKANKMETGDKALQSYLPSIGPTVVNARPWRLATGTTQSGTRKMQCLTKMKREGRKIFLHTEL